VHARASRGLTRSFQIVSIFPRLSVADNAWLAIQGAHADRMAWRSRDPARPEKIVALLERCGLADRRHQAAGTLSHGDQRRLELALAMASQPRLLLLDEPMAGIGPGETEGVARLIEDAARQAAVILVEHDMDTVFRLAHRVVVLQQGRVIANGSPEEVRRDPDVRRAYLGEAEPA
jgi:branched-chain amino acid transport system ATP-binding protein